MTATHPHYQDDGGPILIGDRVTHNEYGVGFVAGFDYRDVQVQFAHPGVPLSCLPQSLTKDDSVQLRLRVRVDDYEFFVDAGAFTVEDFSSVLHSEVRARAARALNAIREAAEAKAAGE